MPIRFISKLSDFQVSSDLISYDSIRKIIVEEKKKLGEIKYIFVGEDEIFSINSKYLGHRYHTDIITFDASFINLVSGEIYICIPVIIENSKLHSKEDFISELNRVMIHGILHLIGYRDYSEDEQVIMRAKEDFYLKMI